MQPRHITLSRRRILQLGGAAAAGPWLAGTTSAPAWAVTPDDYAAVRTRWRDLLTGGDTLDPEVPQVHAVLDQLNATAEQRLASMDRSADRTYLWPNLDFTGDEWDQSFEMAGTYGQLRQLALTYATKGTAREGDPELLEAVIDGLDWMYEHKYNENTDPGGGSWYQIEIATPRALNPAVALIADALDADAIQRYLAPVDRWNPAPEGSGSNLTNRCEIIATRASLVEDDAKLILARDGVAPAMTVVTDGDGIYADGSYLFHRFHPYNGAYGASQMHQLSRLLYFLSGSPWAVSGSGMENLMDWTTEGFITWLHQGAMMGPVRGREVARFVFEDHARGSNAVRSVMWLAHSADPEHAQQLRGLVRHTLESDHYGDLFDTNELGTIVELGAIADDPRITPQPPAYRNKLYPIMDRVVHRRPGFTFALSMSSSRIYTYESINDSNLRGWHTGSGMHYLYNDDQAHYDEAYWPTVDHTRMPGTTVPAGEWEPAAGAQHLSDEDWVGGASLGTLGAAGMAFHTYSPTDPQAAPRGKKSWFMFDDRIVAAGVGITSSSGSVVESIVENRRLLDPNQRLVVDGADQGTDPWERTFDNPTWAHLQGATPSAAIGYVFGDNAALQAKRESRTGAWSDINQNGTNGDPTPITREYLTLWFDHGVDPVDATYAYTLLPGADPATVRRYARRPGIELVANTPAVQAARSGGTFAANFWRAEATSVNGITCSGAASVLVVQDATEITVAVSDPTHRDDGVVRLSIPRRAATVRSADPRITVEQLEPMITLAIDVGGSQGATAVATFTR